MHCLTLSFRECQGGLYCGGSAKMVEKALGVAGDDILYVGDHIYTDAGELPSERCITARPAPLHSLSTQL